MSFQPLLPLALSLVLAAPGMAQSPRIVLQGTSGPTVHSDLGAAITAAQPGDRLYLSGGTFLLAGPYALDKPLHFIGAGTHPDSSNVTGTTTIGTTGGSSAHFQVTTPASGSTFTGIIFNPGGNVVYGTSTADDDPTGIVFQRCEFKQHTYLGFAEGATSSTTFDECIFRDAVTGRSGQAVITRSILDGATLTVFRPSGLFLKNSVILNARLQNSHNPIVQNCVFTYNGAPLYQVSGAQVSNCLVSGAGMFSNSSASSETNNLFNVPVASMFVDQSDNSYQYSDDLQLSPTSGGIGMGNDGTDIGLYGTHAPYKGGNVPFNPHYQQAEIAPSTDWNGALPVNIRTAAQTH
ncbi:MAG: hypothetical protein RBT71_00315 [Flavobacteriales bacterium]|jgi:hypothetical protein|nr:hypothetical protein [Flavobacteriales bacterium]